MQLYRLETLPMTPLLGAIIIMYTVSCANFNILLLLLINEARLILKRFALQHAQLRPCWMTSKKTHATLYSLN